MHLFMMKYRRKALLFKEKIKQCAQNKIAIKISQQLNKAPFFDFNLVIQAHFLTQITH